MLFRPALVAVIATLGLGQMVLATEYLVAQQNPAASDDNAGTPDKPFKTINRGIKVLKAGDTLTIGKGVYREQVVVAAQQMDIGGTVYPPAPSGQNSTQAITVKGADGAMPMIKGSDLVTGWVPVKGKDHVWVKAQWPYSSQQVFVDSKPLQQIGGKVNAFWSLAWEGKAAWQGRKGNTLADLEAGSFFFDGQTKELYVWLADGSDPNQHEIEAGVRPFCFLLNGLRFWHLAGLKMAHANTSADFNWGALTLHATDSIVDNVDVSWCDSVGLSLSGRNVTIRNSHFNYNGNSGISAGTIRGALLLNNETSYNNTRNWNRNWHAGGIKLIPFSYDVLVSGHRASHNNGTGIWFDTSNSGITIENSVSDHNKGMGIFYEISERGIIRNNIVNDNLERGIYVSYSSDTAVFHNLCFRNGMSGICVMGDGLRPAGAYGETDKHGFACRRNTVRGNILMDNCHPDLCPRGTAGNGQDWTRRPELIMPDPAVSINDDNTSDYNIFYRSDGRYLPFWYNWGTGAWDTLAAWQSASGNDKHSVVAQALFVDAAAGNYRPAANSPAVRMVPPQMSVSYDAADRDRPNPDAVGIDCRSTAGPFEP